MNNKINIINNSINEIREILGQNCADIEQLPDLVRELVEDPSKNGFTTAFVFSSNSNPNIPSGGSLDTTTGMVIGLEEGWSQQINSKASAIWMSFAIFNPSGERITEWSTPVNLKGEKGERGVPGEVGAIGPAGPQGEKGDSSNSYRTVSVYTSTDTIEIPAKPIGGKWNLETNEIDPPYTEVNVEWVLNADETDKKKYLWMSQATFGESGNLINDWCNPFRLTGDDGKNGVDGRVTEFIYRLIPDLETYKLLVSDLFVHELYSPEYEEDYVPEVTDSLNISTFWTDQPQGISETQQIEVCCSRTRKGIDEKWSEWSDCIIWSKWGEDGMDGDGVEYIYLITPDKTNEGEPVNTNYVLNYFTPDRNTALNDEKYQQDEFCFNDDWGYEGYDWTDEPKDVSKSEPLEWVMIRKKKKNENGEVVWGKFSDPAIWGRFASDGYSYLTSFVFTRSSSTPSTPTGGSYDNPYPDEEIWKDSIPAISTSSTGSVWMSTRVFYSGDASFDSDWTEPKIIADTHDFQVEYCAEQYITGLTKYTGDEESWRASQEQVWGDDDTIVDPIWMATATCDNGVWSDWVITRIKGEKGDAGKNGSSVAIEGQFNTKADLLAAWNKYVTTLDVSGFYFESKDYVINQGDGWYVIEEGLLYTYSGGWIENDSDSEFDHYWFSTPIKGEPGDKAYMYTAFADVWMGPVKTVGNNGAVAGKYIGVRSSDKALSDEVLKEWSTYTWTQWKGEDGWGQEQIFLLTSKNASYDPAIAGKKPLLPVNEEGKGDTPEYLPLHGLGDLAKGADDQPDRWADSPLTVSEDYPYCWVVSRSVPEFGDWKGDGSYASLYSRYSYDGNSTISVNLTNDVAVIPMEGDIIDPEFIANNIVSTNLQVFIGDDPVPSNRTTVSIDNNYATWDENTDTITLNLNNIPSNINEIPIIVTVDGGSNHTITWKLFKTNTAYEISPDIHVIKRYSEGDEVGQLETKSFDVKIKKWDGEKWIASNKAVFVEVTTKEGKQYYSNQSEVVTETVGGVATIDVGEIQDIKVITVYLTNDDKDNGARISFEDIAIVSDGITGPQGEQGVPGENGKDAVISQAMLDQATANIAQGFYTKEQIDELERNLNDAIENSGDKEAIAKAATALKTAEDVNAALESLEKKILPDGKLDGTLLKPEDVYNLSVAGLGNDIADSEGELHENAVFAKQIVGLVATFGSIDADNITGDSISGKTVQSSDADGNLGEAWKLEGTGAGHVANGQISWNADGSEVRLGSNVKLTWNNISDAVTSDNINNLVTNIDGSKIQTGTITANKLDIDDVAAKVIEAEEATIKNLAAQNVTAEKLNTTPGTEGAGTILIEGNELKVYNKSKNVEVVKISGDILDDYPDNASYSIPWTKFATFPINYVEGSVTSGAAFYKNLNLLSGNIVVVPETKYDLNFRTPGDVVLNRIFINVTDETTSIINQNVGVTWGAGIFWLWVKESDKSLVSSFNVSENTIKKLGLLQWYNDLTTMIDDGVITLKSSASSAIQHALFKSATSIEKLTDLESISAGTYYIYPVELVYAKLSGNFSSLNYLPTKSKIYVDWTPPTTLSINPIIQRSDISPYGIRFISSATDYLSVNTNRLIVRKGINGFGCDYDGFFVIKNGVRYEVSTSDTGETVNWENYK